MNADDWTCPVCLELAYKPCVNSCGHIFCFWCMHKAMSAFTSSKCPSCRASFSYFPRVCETLHEYLRDAFREKYDARAQEIEEEGVPGTSSSPPEDQRGSPPAPPPDDLAPIERFRCVHPDCGELLFKPTVLNCGHMVCLETCAHDALLTPVRACPACCETTAVGEPKICLKVHEFLEEALPEEQRRRAEATRALVEQRRARIAENSSAEAQMSSEGGEKAQLHPTLLQKLLPAEDGDAEGAAEDGGGATESSEDRLRQNLSDNYIHHGVGCDQCGHYPIVGERYRCVECSRCEHMGFDLCGRCMSVDPEMVRGRFNQHHTPDHTMEKVNNHITVFHMLQAMNPGVPVTELMRLMEMQFGRGGYDDDDELEELDPIVPPLEVAQVQWPPQAREEDNNEDDEEDEGEGEQEGAEQQGPRATSLVHRNSWRRDELEGLRPTELLADLLNEMDEDDDDDDDDDDEDDDDDGGDVNGDNGIGISEGPRS